MRWCYGALLSVLLVGSGLALAADEVTVKLSVGPEGKYVTGRWNGVTATITNPGDAFNGTLQVETSELTEAAEAARKPSYVQSLAVAVPHGASRHDFGVLLPWRAGPLTVRLIDVGRGILLEHKESLEQIGQRAFTLFLVVTRRPEAFAAIRDVTDKVVMVPPDRVPADSRVLDAVDRIMLDNVRLADLSSAAKKAIRRWAGSGGALLLSAPFLEMNAASPELTQFTLVRVTGGSANVPARGVDCLLAPSQLPSVGDLRVLHCQTPPEYILAVGSDCPIVFQHPYERGSVRGLTTDPAWLNSGDVRVQIDFARRFWTRAIENSGVYTNPTCEGRATVPAALTPDESRPNGIRNPLKWYLVIFVVVVGPLNFAVLSLLKRKEWLVFTAPAAVIVFLAAAGVLGLALHSRHTQLAFSTISFCDANTPGLAVTRYFGVSSPATSQHTVTLDRADATPEEFRPSEYEAALANAPEFAWSGPDALVVKSFLVPQWSMRAFGDTDRVDEETVAGGLTIGPDGLTGSVTNHLPTALRGCYLIHKWNHVAVGDIAPGQTVPVTLKLGPPSLSEYKLSRTPALLGLGGWLDKHLWEEDLSDRKWDLLREVSNLTPRLGQPLLIGSCEALQSAPRPAEADCTTFGEHLVVARLPVKAAGPNVTVPLGGAIMDGRGDLSDWITAATVKQDIPEAPDGLSRPVDFMIPTGQANLRHVQLEVQGYLTADPTADHGSDVQLQLWDWRAAKWITANSKLSRSFQQAITEPKRFILMPSGLVRARVNRAGSAGSFYDRPEVTWIDIAYQGEVVPR
jgi:hypothetical protein